MSGRSCPVDVLGRELGCDVVQGCSTRNWQAKNDCYCRPDLQQPAHQWLTSCIQSSCSVGDAAIDASTAGSIYAQYCAGKGYPSGPLPATVQATVTAADGSVHTSTRVFVAPTGSSTGASGTGLGSGTGSSTTASSSKSNSLSLTTIIGIVVGILAGLAFLAVAIKVFLNFCGPCMKRKPATIQHTLPLNDTKAPIYPAHPYQELYYPSPRMDEDLRPDDSFSVAGGLAQPAPTLISDGGPPRRW
ncbi:hypothetical protein BDU57DRAFT_452785 [Ampelomyces quisqualis]|uniref:Extracellular membrane protein CFEM domain-containing protein n=1 Tax=Ampelomyces quisqualis TaxID=50730 RepID=A0A6A5QLU3_AMPQU|nr:hypothetical protein BDU57DRAFT_452785 [Ampelomyces quisqualis]